MKTIKIGRSGSNNIVLPDKNERVSRLHAEVKLYPNGRIKLIDRSTNGTWVNGLRLQRDVEYTINRNDRVVFARAFELDWKKIPEIKIAAGYNFSTSATNFLKDAGFLVDEMTDLSSIGNGIRILGSVLRGGVSRIIQLVNNDNIPKKDIISFYVFGLTAAVIVFSNSIYSWDGLKENGSTLEISELFKDIGMSTLLALLTFLLAVTNYRIFKWLSGSEKRWRHYFRVYCYTAGTYFWLVAIVLLPTLLSRGIFGVGSAIFTTMISCSVILLLLSTVWAITIWVLVNIRFWN